jgi:tartrate-resistant acid phosphatase type 5
MFTFVWQLFLPYHNNLKIMKKALTIFCFLACLIACQSPVQNAVPEIEYFKGYELPADAYSFLVLGDWGRRGQFLQRETGKQMGITAEEMNARFIITTGDNFYPSGVESVEDSHWKASFEDVYTHHGTQVPWYVVLGNHDYEGNVEAQIAYSKKSYRWNMPDRYYAFEKSIDEGVKALFVMIDTNPLMSQYYGSAKHSKAMAGQDSIRQKVWIDSVLQASKARWKFVVGHHMVFTSGKRVNMEKDLQRQLKPLLDKHKVDAYFAGHEHDLQHQKPPGHVHYFISGAGSELRPTGQIPITRFSASTNGFMLVSLTRSQMKVQVIDLYGNVIYRTTINKDE